HLIPPLRDDAPHRPVPVGGVVVGAHFGGAEASIGRGAGCGSMGHGHTHGPVTAGGAQRHRLVVVLGLTLAVMAAEIVGALVSGSLALLADAGHMATDAVGIALALGAVTLAQRPARGR